MNSLLRTTVLVLLLSSCSVGSRCELGGTYRDHECQSFGVEEQEEKPEGFCVFVLLVCRI